jgi:hypothetical protein
MISRIEWLETVMRYGERRYRGRQVLFLIAFETYYQLCKLRGYKPRHFLDPLSPMSKSLPPGTQRMLIWPRLPLSIRLLNRIFPEGRLAHADCVPYTLEAAAAARASGCTVAVLETVQGELKAVSS